MFSLIACVGRNRELGKDNKLVFHIKEDMQFFKETTMGHRVVMGRKTWESLPGKLPGRDNLVVTRHSVEGADEVILDIPKFIAENSESPEEIFIIGGGAIYREFLPYAQKLYLTEVDASVTGADTFFPDFEKNQYERQVIRKGKDHDLVFTIAEYVKK